MKKLAALFAILALSFGAAACGPTGIELRIRPPVDKTAPLDFDEVFVQVTADDDVVGESYPVGSINDRPYLVYVWVGDEARSSATIQVQIKKSGLVTPWGDKRITGVAFDGGDVVRVDVDF